MNTPSRPQVPKLKTPSGLRIAKSPAHKRIKLVVLQRDIFKAERETDWKRTHEQTCPVSQAFMRQFGLEVGEVNTTECEISSSLGVYPLPSRALAFIKDYDSRPEERQRLMMRPVTFVAHQKS